MTKWSEPQSKAFRPLPKPAFPKDPRVLARWERRLSELSNDRGLLLHLTLVFTGTKLFYSHDLRKAFRSLLADLLPSFVLKLEVSFQPSSFLLPHGHLLLPVHPRVLPFLKAFVERGAKNKKLLYHGKTLPDPFSLFKNRRVKDLPDLSPLEPLVAFSDSTITTFQASPDLARYLAKQSYKGGLPPILEHNIR